MQAPQRIEKPWGYEIWWAHTDSYAGKLLHVERGHRLSLQYHQRKDESCYVLSGLVRLVKGPSVDELEKVDLGPGSCWRNRPGEIHTIEAIETSLVVEAAALSTHGFPQPTAYFRGRMLWEEASIAAWQTRPLEAPEEMRTAQAG